MKRGIKRGRVFLIFILLIVLVISLSFVSANIFSDIWKKITGRAITGYAIQTTSIIRQDCTGYTNCYTSLSAWESARQRNLVTADEIEIVEIQGTWTAPDTTSVTINGWATDATHYIKIYTTPEARHNGVWSNTAYRLVGTSYYDHFLRIRDKYVKIDGLQISRTGGGGTRYNVGANENAGGFELSNCIINAASNGDGGISLSTDQNIGYKIWNNIIYGSLDRGIYGYGKAFIYSNTIVGASYGIYAVSDSSTNWQMKNNLIKSSNVANFYTNGANGTKVCTNCASSDATADDFGGTGNKINQVFSFIDATNNNYHLSSSDIGAKDFGVSLISDTNLAFTTDIDGETRSGAWDIGADEYGGVSCVPNCAGKQCGNDGCGGICGTCNAKSSCISGICIAQEKFVVQAQQTKIPLVFRYQISEQLDIAGGPFTEQNNHQLFDSATLNTKWALINPLRGVYNWTLLDTKIEQWVGTSEKKVIIKIAPYGTRSGSDTDDNDFTPSWVYDYVPKITFINKFGNQVSVPKIWDPSFYPVYEEFIQELGNKYNTDSRVAGFIIGIGHGGTINGEGSATGGAAFEAEGWTLSIWEKHIQDVIIISKKHLTKQLIMAKTIAFLNNYKMVDHPDVAKRVFEYAAQNGISPLMNGLEPNFDDFNKTFVPELVRHLATLNLPADFTIGFSDDWPLWVPTIRSENCPGPTCGRNLTGFDKEFQNVFDLWNSINRKYPIYFAFWEPESIATNQYETPCVEGGTLEDCFYKPVYDVAVKWLFITQSSVCGDGTCNSTETCLSCPQDCGVCQDTQPPERTNPYPIEPLPAGTTTTTISLTTDEDATCHYDTSPNVNYSSMLYTFSATGGTSHSQIIVGLTNRTYNYYVRCNDIYGNINPDDFIIIFTVLSGPPPPCFLNNASFNQTTANEGDLIQLIVDGTTNCDGKTIRFEVWESDTSFSDDPAIGIPSSVSFISGRATSNWTAEWQCDGEIPLLGCVAGNPEYYFKAILMQDSTTIDSKNNPLLDVSPSLLRYRSEDTNPKNGFTEIDELQNLISEWFISSSSVEMVYLSQSISIWKYGISYLGYEPEEICTDVDGDGYGVGAYLSSCTGSTTQEDCNDANSSINPGATEICTGGEDENCDDVKDCLDDNCLSDLICQQLQTKIPLMFRYTISQKLDAAGGPFTEQNNHQLINSVILNIKWAQAEPLRGTYNWTLLDTKIEQWVGTSNKKVIINFAPYRTATDEGDNDLTPVWVYDYSVPRITFIDSKGKSVSVPKIWDPNFYPVYEEFIQELGNKYNTDSRVSGFVIGIGHSGTINAEGSKGGEDAFKAEGWTLSVWEKHIQDVIIISKKHLTKQLIMQKRKNFLNNLFLEDAPDVAKRVFGDAAQNGISPLMGDMGPNIEGFNKSFTPELVRHLATLDLPSDFTIGFFDDLPLWVPPNRSENPASPTSGRNVTGFDNEFKYVFDLWDSINRKYPIYFDFRESESVATNQYETPCVEGGTLEDCFYKPVYDVAVKWLFSTTQLSV